MTTGRAASTQRRAQTALKTWKMSTGGRLHTLRPSQRAPHTRTAWGWGDISHSADEKKFFFRIHRSHQVTGRAKKKIFFRRENDSYPSTPIPCGYAEHIGTSWKHTTDLRCSFSTFFKHFGLCRWVLAARPAGKRGVALWQIEDGSLHESTPAVAEPPLATSCGDLAALAD